MAFKATPDDVKMIDYLAGFYADPLGFVMAVYPWQMPDTILADEEGPDKWQAEYLEELGKQVLECDDGVRGVIQMAVASGHGVGKTSLVAWIIHWFLTTRPNAHIVATANTGAQLSDKTWRELAKWKQLAINGHHFEWTATSYKFIPSAKTQYAMGIPWSEHNSESFAGLHETYVMTLYDEASGIPDTIWEVTAGALTTGENVLHLVFGNMTKSSGRFHSCFHKDRKRWTTFSVDSRTAKKTNKKILDEWIEDYGIDSDFVRVRVLGLPPNQATLQFIPTDVVMAAFEREHKEETYRHAAKVLAVDVAREGDDSTVLCCRHGLKLLWEKEYRGLNLMEVVQVVAEFEDKENPDAVFIDEVGIGAGVIDRGRELGRQWIGHKGSHKSSLKSCGNKRAECWYKMRTWLEDADLTALQKDRRQVMIDDLTGIEYCFDRIDRTLMEKKIDMKRRGLASPDHGDALAMTFTQTVIPKQMLEDEYDYAEAERSRRQLDNTRSPITGY